MNCVYLLYGSFDLGFELAGSYLENIPLVIDPILTYVTYLGGSLTEDARGIAVDTQGRDYATGYTTSIDFPVTPGAFQTTSTGSSAFITKLALDGSALIYSTFLSGNSNSSGRSISVDSLGNAYITGRASGPGFPVSPGGESLIASTYLGGTVTLFIPPTLEAVLETSAMALLWTLEVMPMLRALQHPLIFL